jgi:hypothetical protein
MTGLMILPSQMPSMKEGKVHDDQLLELGDGESLETGNGIIMSTMKVAFAAVYAAMRSASNAQERFP